MSDGLLALLLLGGFVLLTIGAILWDAHRQAEFHPYLPTWGFRRAGGRMPTSEPDGTPLEPWHR